MKNTFNTRIFLPALSILIISIISVSCSKSNDKKQEGGDPLGDLVPAQDRTLLEQKGMTFYKGSNPPSVNGKYLMKPLEFKFDNYREPNVYPSPGTIITNGQEVEFSAMNSTSITYKVPAYFTSLGPLENMFIVGEGQNFTAGFKVKLFGGMSALFAYNYAYIFSGTVEGTNIRNMKMAKIGLISNSNAINYSVEHQVEWYLDKDLVTEQIP